MDVTPPPAPQIEETHRPRVEVDPLRELAPSHCHTPSSSLDKQHLDLGCSSAHLKQCSTVTLGSSPPSDRLERVNVRLASAFIIFFVFGWGDGGMFYVLAVNIQDYSDRLHPFVSNRKFAAL